MNEKLNLIKKEIVKNEDYGGGVTQNLTETR